MATRYIEYAITDIEVWKGAFDRLGRHAPRLGVLAHRRQRPVVDPAYVVIDLDFGATDEARTLLDLHTTKAWSVPHNAPALAGMLHTKIVHVVEQS
jgi:hypothetical protein